MSDRAAPAAMGPVDSHPLAAERRYGDGMPTRMLTLDQVAEELSISKSQTYALVRRKDLRAGKIGGRGQWRVQRADLEAYIEQTWTDTAAWIDEHPFAEGDEPDDVT